MAQPVTKIGACVDSFSSLRIVLRFFLSAWPVTVQVFTMMRLASLAQAIACQPAHMSAVANFSLSA